MKKALFVWGGWDGHEPRQCTDIFAPIMEKEGYDVEISDTLDVCGSTIQTRSAPSFSSSACSRS